MGKYLFSYFRRANSIINCPRCAQRGRPVVQRREPLRLVEIYGELESDADNKERLAGKLRAVRRRIRRIEKETRRVMSEARDDKSSGSGSTFDIPTGNGLGFANELDDKDPDVDVFNFYKTIQADLGRDVGAYADCKYRTYF